MKNYYTQGEYKELLKHICIVGTTNEQKNDHIKAFFDKKKICFEERSLKVGDYCFKINACADLGFNVDTYFTDELFIERKNSLEELASSINNEAFHYELKRSQLIANKYLLIEQKETQVHGWDDILNHNYSNNYNEKSFWTTLHTFEVRYDLKIKFIPKDKMGLAIYTICKSVLDSKILK